MEKVTELGIKANFKDEILVEGNLIEYQEKEYYLFYKPRYVVCTTKDDKGRKTVLDFFDDVEKEYILLEDWIMMHQDSFYLLMMESLLI